MNNHQKSIFDYDYDVLINNKYNKYIKIKDDDDYILSYINDFKNQFIKVKIIVKALNLS